MSYLGCIARVYWRVHVQRKYSGKGPELDGGRAGWLGSSGFCYLRGIEVLNYGGKGTHERAERRGPFPVFQTDMQAYG